MSSKCPSGGTKLTTRSFSKRPYRTQGWKEQSSITCKASNSAEAEYSAIDVSHRSRNDSETSTVDVEFNSGKPLLFDQTRKKARISVDNWESQGKRSSLLQYVWSACGFMCCSLCVYPRRVPSHFPSPSSLFRILFNSHRRILEDQQHVGNSAEPRVCLDRARHLR